MLIFYIFLNVFIFISVVVNKIVFSNDNIQIILVPHLLKFMNINGLYNGAEVIPLSRSVNLFLNSSIPQGQSFHKVIKSLLFFSPDIHDGTMTDLAVSLTSQGHSIFFFNGKGALPIYTGLRSVTLSEEEYLQLSGTRNKSRIVFASKALCKTSKLFAYNMKSVERLWLTFHNSTLFRRVDAIICMFYPSECQNYLAFNKTVIFMPAHRFLIKRCLLDDSKSLMKWMFNQPKAPVIVMAAGKYDAEYINYYSGKNVDYIYASTVLMYSPPTT